MEPIWNAICDYKEHKEEIHAICERIAGFQGSISSLFTENSDEQKQIIVLFSTSVFPPSTNISIVFTEFNGISIARYTKHLANNYQVLRDFPQEIADAEARCEEINAELMI